MAPEILSKNKEAGKGGKREYTEACDLWSIGVVSYTLLTGRLPFTE